MKKILLGIMLVVSFATWVSAESSVWKAQKGASVIYLGGTFHILRDKDFPLPPEYEKAYRASDIVVFETDLALLQDPITQRKLLSKAMYPDGSTIDSHLSAAAYAELKAYCEANGIPLETLSRLRPSMLMVTLAVMELTKLGVTRQGVDQHFYDLADADGKTIEALETADEQIDFVVSMADGFEEQFVIYSIRDMRNVENQFDQLVDAWRRGNETKLEEMLLSDARKLWPQLYRKLFADRNRNWLAAIDGYQKTPRTEFILVGVGHLVGPEGIIEELKRKGYKVDRL